MSFKKSYLLALLFGFTIALEAQTYLDCKLKVSDTLKIYQIFKQEFAQKLNVQEHKVVNNLCGDYLFYVKNETDSSYELDFKCDYFFMKTTSNLAGIIFDFNTKKAISKDDMEVKTISLLVKEALIDNRTIHLELNSVDENLHLSFNNNITLSSKDKNITMTLERSQESVITFDKTTGWTTDAKITATAKEISIVQGIENIEILTTHI